MPWLSAGLEKAQMGFGGADFEGCLLGSAVVVAVAGRVSVATVVSRVRRVQSGSSLIRWRSLMSECTVGSLRTLIPPNKSLDGERTELPSATLSMLY